MPHGRALLFSSLLLLTGSPYLWAKRQPPEVIYPTSDDQQSLDQLLNRYDRIEAAGQEKQKPEAAPLKLPGKSWTAPPVEEAAPVEQVAPPEPEPVVEPEPVQEVEKPHPQPLSQRERGESKREENPLPSGLRAEGRSGPQAREGTATTVAGGEAPQKYKVYIWQETGDTLWRIAQKVYGDKDKWPVIYEANRDVLKDPHKIYPKQVLKIPPMDWQP